MKTRLIGLVGPKRSGKTTIAHKLTHRLGPRAEIASFAAPIKRMTMALLLACGLEEEDAMDRVYFDKKEVPLPGTWHPRATVSARCIMQSLGTEWGRNCICNNFWVHAGMHRVDKILRSGGVAIVDDVRFPNEGETIDDHGGLLVGLLPGDRVKEDEHSQHESEAHALRMAGNAHLVLDTSGKVPLGELVDTVLRHAAL